MKAAYDQLEKDAKEPKKLSDDNEKLKSELDKLRGEHEKLQSELEKTKKEKAAEVEAIKKQASTSHATATRAQPSAASAGGPQLTLPVDTAGGESVPAVFRSART